MSDIATKLTAIAENQQKVHDAGHAKGHEAGLTEGYNNGYSVGVVDGKQAEYDRFWDAYQQNGNRTEYQMAFAGQGWNDELFKPKYLIKAQNAERLFNFCAIKNIVTTGVIDFSSTTKASYMFMGVATESIDLVDLSNVSGEVHSLFFNSQALHTIGKLVMNESITLGASFNACHSLANITFEGAVGKTISFSACSKLTDASVQSIIDHLKDLTGATAQTLTFHATVGGKLTDEQKTTISTKNWTLVY